MCIRDRARLERQGDVIKLFNREGLPGAYALKTGKFATRVRENFEDVRLKQMSK